MSATTEQEPVFRSKHSGRIANAQAVAEELYRISKANGGDLTPEAVLKNARSKSSPIHNHFTWDDTEAARKCRLYEASMLIRSVKVTVETHPQDKPILVRAFVNVAKADPDESEPDRSCYVPLKTALDSNEYRQQMLRNALNELGAFRRKYALLKELSDVFEAFDKIQPN